LAPRAYAQGAASRSHLVEGRVLRAAEEAGRPEPVPRQWVVLHRVGPDRAGPLDSMRTGADGRFRFRYAPSGDADALYFLSAQYSGIAYFSPPMRASVVTGGDADLTVYDTTPDTSKLRVQGRHLVLSAPRGANREVAEVFELENQGVRTIVARDSTTPVWATILPEQAESARVAPGDVSAGAVVFRRGRAEVFAPISPGIRQIVLTYQLPPDAFPVRAPMQRPVSVLEVLLEEPRASVEGARLDEVASAPIEGRMFRRFLAQDVPASAVVEIGAPEPIEQNRGSMRVVLLVVGMTMVGAMVTWLGVRRGRFEPGRRRSLAVGRAASDANVLIAELATLDARFDRETNASADARARHERERAELKEKIARALAAEKRAG
jgi:hypothetical protein